MTPVLAPENVSVISKGDAESLRGLPEDHSVPAGNVPVEEQDIGVTRIEALYRAFGTGKGLAPIWMLYVSIGLISFAYSLSSNTVSNFLTFATSSYNAHSLLGAIDVSIYILGAVGKPGIFTSYSTRLTWG